MDYIESKYEEYLNAESRVHRQPMRDNRVHVCLYFIQPSGHGLKPLDVEFMKRLHDKVNIIPILAKADTMTPDECAYFKKQVSLFFFLYSCIEVRSTFLTFVCLLFFSSRHFFPSGSQRNCSA